MNLQRQNAFSKGHFIERYEDILKRKRELHKLDEDEYEIDHQIVVARKKLDIKKKKNILESIKNNIDKNKQCIVCWGKEATWAPITCGHKNYCSGCKDKLHQCSVCRAHISSTSEWIKIYE